MFVCNHIWRQLHVCPAKTTKKKLDIETTKIFRIFNTLIVILYRIHRMITLIVCSKQKQNKKILITKQIWTQHNIQSAYNSWIINYSCGQNNTEITMNQLFCLCLSLSLFDGRIRIRIMIIMIWNVALLFWCFLCLCDEDWF